MIIFGITPWAFPDGNDPTCPEAGGKKNHGICKMQQVLADGSSSLYMLTGFILGGYLASTVGLWLTRRTAYASLCGATRMLLINVTTLAPPDAQQLLARWTLLGYELSILKARDLIDSTKGEHYLQVSNLLVADEWAAMVDGDRHTTVWYWIQRKAKQLKEQGHIDAFELQTICNSVTASRAAANDLMSKINRDQPPPYIFVCSVLVQINLIFETFARGLMWAAWMNDAGGLGVFRYPFMWTDIFVLYLWSTIFAILFDVCALLYNPFGPRSIDLRHDLIGGGIRKLAMSLSRQGETNIPASFDTNVPRNDFSNDVVDYARIASAENSITAKVQVVRNSNQLFPTMS